MRNRGLALETIAAWCLALLWLAPLAYAFWSAFHPPEYATKFDLTAPLVTNNPPTAGGIVG